LRFRKDTPALRCGDLSFSCEAILPRFLSHALKLKESDCGSSAGSEEPLNGLEMSSALIEVFEAWVICRASSWICSPTSDGSSSGNICY
jgi:hypothetical protein